MARSLLIFVLVFGLVPSLGEVVEAAIHLGATGHSAHGEGCRDLPNDAEHGCTPTAHHCGCCATQPILPRGEPLEDALLIPTTSVPSSGPQLPREGTVSKPFRPPIA